PLNVANQGSVVRGDKEDLKEGLVVKGDLKEGLVVKEDKEDLVAKVDLKEGLVVKEDQEDLVAKVDLKEGLVVKEDQEDLVAKVDFNKRFRTRICNRTISCKIRELSVLVTSFITPSSRGCGYTLTPTTRLQTTAMRRMLILLLLVILAGVVVSLPDPRRHPRENWPSPEIIFQDNPGQPQETFASYGDLQYYLP
ncbi:unnamed protein product, partial [Timema podura]|nr:unnamed protein product [Timema podura]